MEPSTATSEEATTRFVRPAVDVDDTIPVALYSRPYERLELETIAGRGPPGPARPLPRAAVAAVLLGAFSCGFALVVGLLG